MPRAPDRLARRAALSTSVAKRAIVLRQAAACSPSALAALRGLRAGAPQREQLVDARLGELRGAAAARIGDELGVRRAVGAQDLAHALARDAEAQRDLVEAAAALAQRAHLAHALLRAGGRRGAVVEAASASDGRIELLAVGS